LERALLKSRKEKLEDSAALLSAIIDSSHDAIVSKTLEGFIESWNRSAEKMFGYSAAEAVGQHITLIIPPERHAEEDQVLAQIRRGERVDHFETVRQTKDGRKLNISLTVSPVRDAAGRVIGASKIARDITDRKRAEVERDELLAREKNAREAAEQANRLKDDFLATISHELRNPLHAIVGWVALLQTGKLNAQESAHAIEAIQRGAQAQNRLINDLLDVSRIITGRLRLNVHPFELAEVINNTIEIVRPAAQAKKIKLDIQLERNEGPIAGDPDRLQQVFWNLLSNAVKFTPAGGHVQIVLKSVNSQAQVTVSDTGIGITPDLLPFVFDRFRQGDATSTRQAGGLGLGLAITRHLIELHGGTVLAESEGLGRGAAFTVRLPLVVADRSGAREERAVAAASGPISLQGVPSLSGLRILVVDDDSDSRDIIAIILGQANAEVRSAGDALQALKLMDEWEPDVLLSDIAMPQIDGYELIRRVRARPPQSGGNIAAAALTAYARREDRLRILSAGFHMHIPKPVEPAELITVVANIAGRV